MPNHLQLLFLGSFFLTFVSLLTLSHYLLSKLRQEDYDISNLILLGLPRIPHPPMSAVAPSLLDVRQSVVAQIVAILLTVASSAFIYLKFGRSAREPVLDPKEWKEFPLKEKIVVSPNTAVYRFALPHQNDVLGLPIGQHINVSAEIGGKEIMRSYTPTSSDDDLGHFDLLIKSYEKGNISRYVSFLKIGDKIRVKGPKGQFNYTPTLSREIGMIAGGTGITPMLQIIRAALKNPQDRTKLSLIYANVNYEDILLKKELDELADKYPTRFEILYVLNNPPTGWIGGVGFVSKEQIATHLPATHDNIKILLCGPPPMMTAMKKHLDELKYPAPRTISKLVDQVFLF
ncbi:ferredoxin reductase-like C-terminal NADP-linked domain-containing protein [Lactarius psammicola]|nr:ferredoxin reductase-like C-terminal NADP-linked domain-containing protein [Lactarius psammicola]